MKKDTLFLQRRSSKTLSHRISHQATWNRKRINKIKYSDKYLEIMEEVENKRSELAYQGLEGEI